VGAGARRAAVSNARRAGGQQRMMDSTVTAEESSPVMNGCERRRRRQLRAGREAREQPEATSVRWQTTDSCRCVAIARAVEHVVR